MTAESTRLIEEVSRFLAEQDARGSDDGTPSASPPRILLPYTDSSRAETALEAVVGLSSVLSAEVWVLHIREWDLGMGRRWFLESREEAVAVTRRALDRLHGEGVHARGVVRQAACSRVAEEIADKADELRAIAIVLGARRRRLIPWLFLPSLSRRVSHLAHCPLILARCERSKRSDRRGNAAGENCGDADRARRRAA